MVWYSRTNEKLKKKKRFSDNFRKRKWYFPFVTKLQRTEWRNKFNPRNAKKKKFSETVLLVSIHAVGSAYT